MLLKFKGICTDVYVHPEKGTQSLTFVDMENGGMVKISQGLNLADIKAGMVIDAELQVKSRPDKSGGSYLVYEAGKYGKAA